jgi:hypothetical protein
VPPAALGTLGPLRTLVSDIQPIPFNSNPYPGNFKTATYPHVAVKGGRAIVVGDRRTTASFLFDLYFNSDILARFTDNDGATFSVPAGNLRGQFRTFPPRTMSPNTDRTFTWPPPPPALRPILLSG